jgi:Flp pilus assembly pilin Flp
MITKLLNRFLSDRSGAVTVDWVVLTAAIVGVAIAMVTVIEGGVNTAATEISNALTAQLT